jgi:probable H4MPT-linked C1 transfer pathway protein
MFRGSPTGLAAEDFATTADVYRLLGRLPEEVDQQDPADGRGKSPAETEARLARMVGCDRGDASAAEWHALAQAFAALQCRRLARAALRVAAAADLRDTAPFVGCGTGRFIAQDIAGRLERTFLDVGALLDPAASDDWISFCAPAVAVGLLALGE